MRAAAGGAAGAAPRTSSLSACLSRHPVNRHSDSALCSHGRISPPQDALLRVWALTVPDRLEQAALCEG